MSHRFTILGRSLTAAVLTLAIVLQAAAITARTLTVEDARAIALKHNRDYLGSQQEIIKAQGEIGNARSGALPQVTLGSYYSRNLKLAPLYFEADGEVQELQFGFKNSFGASVSVYQPIWEGGRVFTAYKIARLYKDYSEELASQISEVVVYQAEVLFYQVILEQARLDVLSMSYETSLHNLGVVENMYSQGVVSKFELLRAQVEKSNLEPQIMAAESNLLLAGKQFKSFLGIDLDEEIELKDVPTETSLVDLPSLGQLRETALVARPEMHQSDLMVEMREKAVGVARADYFPKLGAVTEYGWSAESDDFTLDENTSHSWTAGINLSWSLFDGFRTRSAVGIARAEHRQAEINRDEAIDRIKLDVQESYDRLIQAKKALDACGETIAQAEEGLRIAGLRHETGEGTLLEVLSAQTALTQARTAMAEATFGFREAHAALRRATAMNL
ncbi:MAG TPA: TolC family protein [candidate division Zixibacteria bacterium]|nr:TolC family protein [candidate division Zixibacteria bacterium]